MTPMLYGLVMTYAPTRFAEINNALFEAMLAETPFWGVHECIRCSNPKCARELHVLLIDGQMLMVIDQVVRQLYDLIDSTDDLSFREARADERTRARRILSRLVFRTGNAPVRTDLPPTNQLPHCWLAEALRIGFTFMVVHETSHQGPQRMGADYIAPMVPTALAGAETMGLALSEAQAFAWAKELSADLNAFLIMAADARSAGIKDEFRDDWYRAFIAGVGLVFKCWDLIIEEKCYGEHLYGRKLLKTHPPARWRLTQITRKAESAQNLTVIDGDLKWAERLIGAIDELHR